MNEDNDNVVGLPYFSTVVGLTEQFIYHCYDLNTQYKARPTDQCKH